jgi:hypothetical protein
MNVVIGVSGGRGTNRENSSLRMVMDVLENLESSEGDAVSSPRCGPAIRGTPRCPCTFDPNAGPAVVKQRYFTSFKLCTRQIESSVLIMRSQVRALAEILQQFQCPHFTRTFY